MEKKQKIMNWAVDFECPGGDCGLTCCSGEWNIRLIEDEMDQFRNATGELAELIEKGVDFENQIMRNCGKKCALLDEKGFCKLVLAGGEDLLSVTCKLFPRRPLINCEYEKIIVDIVCPVVARNLLDNKPVEYYEVVADGDVDVFLSDEEKKKWNNLEYVMQCIIELLQYQSGKYIWGKSYLMYSIFSNVYELVANNDLDIQKIDRILDRYCGEDTVNRFFSDCERLGTVTENKTLYLCQFISDIYDGGLFQTTLNQLVELYPEVLDNMNIYLKEPKVMMQDLQDFSLYMKENYTLFSEKFFQYSLFENWIELDSEKFGKKFVVRILEHTLMLLSAMALWHNSRELSSFDFSVLIASIDRKIDHSGWDRIEEIYKFMSSRYTRESFLAIAIQMLIV